MIKDNSLTVKEKENLIKQFQDKGILLSCGILQSAISNALPLEIINLVGSSANSEKQNSDWIKTAPYQGNFLDLAFSGILDDDKHNIKNRLEILESLVKKKSLIANFSKGCLTGIGQGLVNYTKKSYTKFEDILIKYFTSNSIDKVTYVNSIVSEDLLDDLKHKKLVIELLKEYFLHFFPSSDVHFQATLKYPELLQTVGKSYLIDQQLTYRDGNSPGLKKTKSDIEKALSLIEKHSFVSLGIFIHILANKHGENTLKKYSAQVSELIKNEKDLANLLKTPSCTFPNKTVEVVLQENGINYKK